MLVLLTLLTAGYFATVVWIVRGTRQARRDGRAAAQAAGGDLPVDDRPPASAVGWPPGGRQFTSYVDEGFRALDAYLSEGYAA
jgi:hypothetical protein